MSAAASSWARRLLAAITLRMGALKNRWVMLAFLGCVAWGMGCWQSRAESPVVTSMSTRWFRTGAEVATRFEGRGLNAAASLWTSFPATLSRGTATSADSNIWNIGVKSTNDEGCGVVRWVGTNGVSDPLLVAWDTLSEVNLAPGVDRAHAAVLSGEARVRAEFRPGAADWFRIPASATNVVWLEVIAGQLGSKGDPYLEVWSDAGRRLLFLEDTPGLGPDIRVRLDSLPPGDKWVAIRDSGFGGGADMEYWIRASRRPWNGFGQLEFSPNQKNSYSALHRGEKEPNDRIDQANELLLGEARVACVRGLLESVGDQDLFRVRLPEAGRYVAWGFGTGIGSAALPRLKWMDEQGKWLGVSSSNGSDEAMVEVTTPTDKELFLAVDDWTGAGGEGFRYEVHIEPSWGLRGSTDVVTLQAKPGDSIEMKVNWSIPKDAKGSFPIGIEGEPWTIEPSQVTVGQKETTLKITLPGDLQAGTIRHIRVGLRAEGSGGNRVRGCVGTRSGLRRLWPGWVFPHPEMDGWIAVGVVN